MAQITLTDVVGAVNTADATTVPDHVIHDPDLTLDAVGLTVVLASLGGTADLDKLAVELAYQPDTLHPIADDVVHAGYARFTDQKPAPIEAPPGDGRLVAALARERDLHERVQAVARELLVLAGDLGWGSGEPYWDAIQWISEAAKKAGYSTAVMTRSCVRPPATMPLPEGDAEAQAGSVVYYLQRANYDIKIGYSADGYRRANALACEYGDLVLLATEPGGSTTETRRHADFHSYRVERTEWFRPGPGLLRHIVALAGQRAATSNDSVAA